MIVNTSNQSESNLWIETPLIYSKHISAQLDCNVYLKLENLQRSQSYKFRGVSHYAQYCKSTRGPSVHLIIASSGNAGLAAATAAKALGLKCTAYITEGASSSLIETLRKDGAEVVIFGKHYLQAFRKAEEALETEENAVMVPAYNDPIVWEGHSSMIIEVEKQLSGKPDAIFCSVGGGGLLGGVILGCKKVHWDDIPIFALETHGSACFYHSVSVNEGRWNANQQLQDGISAVFDDMHQVKVAHVANLTSRASSLGATVPSAGVVKMALERAGGINCITVSDEMSMQACGYFAEDHKMMVELACATTLVPAYSPELLRAISSRIGNSVLGVRKTLVFIVCGGSKISMEEMIEYKGIVEEAQKEEQTVFCNGERWCF